MSIYELPLPVYIATRILQIPNIDQSRIAEGCPIEFERSSTFVVDLMWLNHHNDVKGMDSGTTVARILRCFGVHLMNLMKLSLKSMLYIDATGQDVYYLCRVKSSHPSKPDFRRLIAFVHSKFCV